MLPATCEDSATRTIFNDVLCRCLPAFFVGWRSPPLLRSAHAPSRARSDFERGLRMAWRATCSLLPPVCALHAAFALAHAPVPCVLERARTS